MYQNVLAEMARNNYTREKLSEEIDVCLPSLRKKIRGTMPWKSNEIDYLLSLFDVTYEYLFKKF